MLAYDFDESVGCWIALTSHTMRRALDAELVDENITFRQWEVLAWLSFSSDQTQAEMAENLGIEAPTLAGIISRMERDGWLERKCCPDDRRKKRIKPTERAEAVWTRTVECCKRVRARATEGISTEDLGTLKRVCAQIRENLGGHNLESRRKAADSTAVELIAAGAANGAAH